MRAAYQAFARRDLHQLGLLVNDDITVEWDLPDGAPSTNGRNELLNRLSGLVHATDGTATAELLELQCANTGRLVANHREIAVVERRPVHRLGRLRIDLDGGRIQLVTHLPPT